MSILGNCPLGEAKERMKSRLFCIRTPQLSPMLRLLRCKFGAAITSERLDHPDPLLGLLRTKKLLFCVFA